MVIELNLFGHHVMTLTVGKAPEEVIYNTGGQYELAELPFGFASPCEEEDEQ